MRNRQEKGIALITALLILLLVSSIIVGMSWMVMTDQRLGGNNSDRQGAFYAAEAGMEKMTADLGIQYGATNALSSTDVTTVEGKPPVIQGVTYTDASGASGYVIGYTPDLANGGNPTSDQHTIISGAYAGLQGLITPFTLTVTARLADGAEAKLIRSVQAVGIPVFQFGIFSQVDLSYFPGPVFNFGGRVHTNANLWLASGNTLTLSDKVTAVGDIITSNLSNGFVTYWAGSTQGNQTSSCASSFSSTLPTQGANPNPYPGAIMVAEVPETSCLQLEQGTVTGAANVVNGISTTVNPKWYSLSTGTYNSNILGGKQESVPSLNLSIATPAVGGTPIELIRRPVAGENSQLTEERYYSLSSVNILLDDSAALLTATPNSCGTPVDLSTLGADAVTTPKTGEYTSLATSASWYKGGPEGKLPLPTSDAESATAYTAADGYWIKPHYPIITGYILINLKTAGGCSDVTQEILNLGFIGRNLNPLTATQLKGVAATKTTPAVPAITQAMSTTLADMGTGSLGASTCADPSLSAVIRLARLRDNPSTVYPSTGGCGTATAGGNGTDYWPNVLFDTREAISRDAAPPAVDATLSPNGNLTAGGVINYVELDVNNLSKWFTGKIGKTGATAINPTGYTVYFSDRRGEQNDPTLARKSGAYGFNDLVNPNDATNGCPNGKLDQGEDLAQTGVLSTFGITPVSLVDDTSAGDAIAGGKTPPATTVLADTSDGTCSALGTTWPGVEYAQYADARVNPPLFFRHALKIVNGETISLGTCDLVPCGLTVASENPVYLQGDYNNPGAGTGFTSVGVAASIVSDSISLLSDSWNDANSFWYPYTPSGRPGTTTTYRVAIIAGKGVEFPQVTGTGQDYGTDGGVHNFLRFLESWNGTLYYKGSIVSFYYNAQGVGLYKCCNTVYGPPTRGYNFDSNFLTPALLPPQTPMLRDIDNIGFTQVVSPLQ